MMTRAEIIERLRATHPQVEIGGETYLPGSVEFAAYIEEQADRWQARDAKQARPAGRAALRAQWESLPDFIRGPYRPVFDAANQLLDGGDDAGARAMIQYEEPRSGFSAEQVATFDQVKASFLAAIEQLPSL